MSMRGTPNTIRLDLLGREWTMKKIVTLIASVSMVAVLPLSLTGCGDSDEAGGAPEQSEHPEQAEKSDQAEDSEQEELLEVSSEPLTVKVPKEWVKFDKSSDPDSIGDPWVVGVRDSETETTTQLRLTKDTGQSPRLNHGASEPSRCRHLPKMKLKILSPTQHTTRAKSKSDALVSPAVLNELTPRTHD